LEALANKKGFVSLAAEGRRRVLKGHTSLDEMMRVVDLTSRVV